MNVECVLDESQIEEFFELLIERRGTFDKNNGTAHDNFHYNCISESVVLAPDNNVYSCVFLAQKEFEIDEFIDDKIIVDNSLAICSDYCTAKEICNGPQKVLKGKEIRL